MSARVARSEDGYTLRGGEPPGLRRRPESVRLMFWGWVMELGLRAKDRDLSQGLDRDGKPLRAISSATRKHRHSEMTPGGRGDPSAPPLEPGRRLSRVRSLLTGRAGLDRAEFWWKFDPFTGSSFARILDLQAEQGRDVFGLSPRALKRVMARAWEKYRRWEAAKPVEMPAVIAVPQAPPMVAVGGTDMRHATMGIGAAAPPAVRAGGQTIEAWLAHFRGPAPATIPGRPSAPYNRLLGHVWGQGRPPAGPRPPAPRLPRPRPPAPVRKAAVKPPAPVPTMEGLIAYGASRGHEFHPIGAEELRDKFGWSDFEIASAPAAYHAGERKLYVNTAADYWRHPDLDAVAAAEGSWLARHDARGLIDHEIGHALHHRAVGDRFATPEMHDRRWRGDPDSAAGFERRIELIRAVSGYGATRPVEFVAEVYSGLVAGREYPGWVMELYRRYGGPTP